MLKFDILKIQKNIEERRLVLGQKFEDFLFKKILILAEFFKRIFATKSCAFYGCFAIIAISVLARSARDIGPDSAAYLEVAKKMLAGGKYQQDFFTFTSPLSLLPAILAQLLAQIFPVSPIIALDALTDLAGILSLSFSAKILAESDAAKDQRVFNLVILTFACGFFLRVFTLQFNEFGTSSTLFLALAFPYISCQLAKKSNQISAGILAALLLCLKPQYGILVAVFELRALKSFDRLRMISALLLIGCYLLILLKFFPDYLAIISSTTKTPSSRIFLMLRQDIFPIFLVSFLGFRLIRQNQILQQFSLVSLATGLIILLGNGDYDQRFILHSLSLPLLALLLFFWAKNEQFDWRKNGIFLGLILLIPQFDQKNIFAAALNSIVFWWVFVLVLSAKWQGNLERVRGNSIFLPSNFRSWICFGLLALATIAISFVKGGAEFFWIISAIIFTLMLNFYQKFFHLFAGSIFAVLAYFLGLHSSAIFNLQNEHYAWKLKSPNHFTGEMIKALERHSAVGEKLVVIAKQKNATYPAISYAKREIFDAAAPSRERLKQELQDKKTKLVFVEKENDILSEQCRIGFLENYFRDPEFRKIFLQNYVFLNRLIQKKPAEKRIEFFSDESLESLDIIESDAEIYIRK
jgi:hypothetical protein